jgi:hypothetical protein
MRVRVRSDAHSHSHASALTYPPAVRHIHVKKNFQTGYGTHPASYSVGTGNVKITTHLHLVPKSRTGGTTRLMSLHVLMAWTSKLYIYLYHFTRNKSHFWETYSPTAKQGIPYVYGNQSFIIGLSSVRHWPASQASWLQWSSSHSDFLIHWYSSPTDEETPLLSG